MKIRSIFELKKDQLFVACYDGCKSFLTILQDQWTDPVYLEEFFEANKADLFSGFYGRITIEEAIENTIEEADELFNALMTLDFNNLEKLFRPLNDNEGTVINFQKRKAKGPYYKSWLRIYAISFYDAYVITGGAIKLTLKMETREHTQIELVKLELMRDTLKLNQADHLFVCLDI